MEGNDNKQVHKRFYLHLEKKVPVQFLVRKIPRILGKHFFKLRFKVFVFVIDIPTQQEQDKILKDKQVIVPTGKLYYFERKISNCS